MRLPVLGLVIALTAAHAAGVGGAARVQKPVSFAILEDYDKGQSLDEIDADFALFDELDIATWRGSFGWDDFEPERGRLEFRWLHDFAALAARRGITLRPYIGYTPGWAGRRGRDGDDWNNPPADLLRWSRFAGDLARALRPHPNVASFEIYNEENVAQWWDGSAQEYARVLIAGSRAIREARPDASVLLGGMVFPDIEWIETVCGTRAGARSFDVLPFHAYPETWTPDDVVVENYLGGLDDFVRDADQLCGRKPIWINEMGYATIPGRTERQQASWWVRAVATFLSHPRVEHIGVYEIKDPPADSPVIGDAPNYHLGLARSDRTRKLAFYTVDLLTDLLDVGTLAIATDEVSVTPRDPDVYAHLFARPDGDRVLFIWSRRASHTVSVRVEPAARAVTEYLLDGQPVAVPQAGPVTGQPLGRVSLAPNEPRIFRLQGS